MSRVVAVFGSSRKTTVFGAFFDSTLDRRGEAVLFADNLWGVAAMLWLGSGLLRVFGPFFEDELLDHYADHEADLAAVLAAAG